MDNFCSDQNLNEGWIRRMRLNLGMTLNKLGNACGVATSTIAQLEKREAEGHISIGTLRRAAEAMNCDFTYSFVPKSDMREFFHQRLRESKKNFTLSRSSHEP